MSASSKAAVWNHSFNTALDFLRCGDLDALEVYDIIRTMWVSSMICDSHALSMAKELRDYHADFKLVEHPKLGQFIELLRGE